MERAWAGRSFGTVKNKPRKMTKSGRYSEGREQDQSGGIPALEQDCAALGDTYCGLLRLQTPQRRDVLAPLKKAGSPPRIVL